MVSTGLVHDFLRNFAELDINLRTELSEMFSYAITYEKKVLRQQDRYTDVSGYLLPGQQEQLNKFL
jgi:hypothetical protein